MKINNIIMGIVGIMVCAIMIGGAFLPAVSSAVDVNRQVVNNEYNYYRAVGTDTDITFYSDKTVGDSFLINGETVLIPTGPGQVITSDVLSFDVNAGKVTHKLGYVDGGQTKIVSPDIIDLSIIGHNITGSYTLDGVETEFNLVCEWAFFYLGDTESDWVMYNAYTTKTININDIDQLYGANYINTTSGFFSFNGYDLKVNGVANDTMSIDPVKVNGYEDYYKITFGLDTSDMSFVIDNNGEDYTVHPYYMIVPKSIMVNVEGSEPITAMFEVLPIIAIAGLVMTGIYVFISRK